MNIFPPDEGRILLSPGEIADAKRRHQVDMLPAGRMHAHAMKRYAGVETPQDTAALETWKRQMQAKRARKQKAARKLAEQSRRRNRA